MSIGAKPLIILMADDDADDRLLAQDAITECGLEAELRCVENGEELLDYLNRRGKFTEPASCPRPALILLDLNMPRKDGREALREIKSDPEFRRTPVVVFTTSKADTDIGQIYDIGANSFISKPVSFGSLVEVMKTLGDYWCSTVRLPVRS